MKWINGGFFSVESLKPDLFKAVTTCGIPKDVDKGLQCVEILTDVWIWGLSIWLYLPVYMPQE